MISKASFDSNRFIFSHSVVILESQATFLVCLATGSDGFVGLTCTFLPVSSPSQEDAFPTRLVAASNCSDRGIRQV